MPETDFAVVGGGILGLAVARELRAATGRRVVVLEREDRLGRPPDRPQLRRRARGHLLRAGLAQGAALRRGGARAAPSSATSAASPYERCGKVIVALDESELPGLDELERRGEANGVPGLRRLDAGRAARARAARAPASPRCTRRRPAIVDFGGVAHALADDVRAAGGEILCDAGVTGIEVRAAATAGAGRAAPCGRRARRRLRRVLRRRLVGPAGAAGGRRPDPRIVPFRGAYLRLTPERRASCGR